MTIQDPDFGELTWDDKLDWWAGSIYLSAPEPFQLYIHTQSQIDRDITAEARRAAAWIRNSEAAIRSYAAGQLLETHNTAGWNEQDQDLPAADFIQRLIPDSVSLHPNGYAEVGFADDDMFWGHIVGVRIQADGNFQEAVVEG
jgi:hypothetical protein